MNNATLFTLNTLVVIGIVVAAALAVFLKKPLSSVIALCAAGALTALEFVLLEAPDVAISEAAVGAVLTTAIFVIAVRKPTKKEDEEK